MFFIKPQSTNFGLNRFTKVENLRLQQTIDERLTDKMMEENKNEIKEKPIIGITCGDINGIGLEVTIKALLDARIIKYFVPVILCSAKVITQYRKILQAENFNFNQISEISQVHNRKINVLNLWDDEPIVAPGVESKENGKYTRMSLHEGVELLKSNSIQALVTAPLNKELVQDETFNFPGHTEYLTSAFSASESLMFMVHEELRVGVVTGHIPLSKVSDQIDSEKILMKARIMIKSLQQDFGIKKPRIAVMGLNPHAGEGGLLGPEEEEKIIPAIEELKAEGHLVFGPLPADGFFGSAQYLNFDGILAMYHDQGLIPFKQFAFGSGVNFTAGLSGVRTSPDHGTAFNLAGKNIADPSSMQSALYCAYDILKSRKEFGEV